MGERRRVEIDDLYEFRFPSAPTFSPDGHSLVYVVQRADSGSNSYHSRLWLHDLASETVRPLTTGISDTLPVWRDAQTLMFVARREVPGDPDPDSGPRTKLFSIRKDGGEAQYLFTVDRAVRWYRPLDDGRFAMLTAWEGDPLPELGPDETRVHAFDEAPVWFNGIGFLHVARTRLSIYDPEQDEITDLSPKELSCGAATLAPDQTHVVFSASRHDAVRDWRSSLYRAEIPAPGEAPSGERSVTDLSAQTGLPDGSFTAPVHVSETEFGFLHADPGEHGINTSARLFLCSSSGGEAKLICGDLSYRMGVNSVGSDVRVGANAARLLAAGGSIYLVATRGTTSDLYEITPDSFVRLTDGEGTTDDFDVVDAADGPLLVTVGMKRGTLPELFLRKGEGWRQITELNTRYLETREISRPRHLSVLSGGDQLDAWVLMPESDASASIPAILTIHGGPRTVYGEVFYHEMQLWAARGFAVIFCNPHGSDGRGDEFADIRGRYGTLDFTDIIEVVDQALAAYPRIDPRRLCVTGGSYGGFMTNWIIGRSSRFVAAASQRSISNWMAFWGTSDIGYYFANDQLDASPWENPQRYWSQSPIAHAQNVRTPTLFLHSDADHRCWIQDALQMHTALRYHGVPSRLVWVEGENHELSRSGKPQPRTRRLQEITDWFERYTSVGQSAETTQPPDAPPPQS